MTRRDLLILAAAAPLAAADTDIDRFFQSYLEKGARAYPESATFLRVFAGPEQDRLDGQLDDISDEYTRRQFALGRQELAELRKFDRSKMTPVQRLAAEILEYQIESSLASEPHVAYSFPLNQFRGVQVSLAGFLTDVHPMRNRKDAENYLLRLEAAGPKINQALKIMQDRARQGIRLPGFIAVETIAQMKRFTAPEPAQHLLVTSFAQRLKRIESIEPAQQTALVASAEKIVRESVYPAYYRAVDGLASENAKATEDAGLWRLPKGAEAYAVRLRQSTTTDLSPDQIHRKGLDEVARIEAEMEILFRKLGYTDGSIVARFAKLQSDNLYADGPDVRARVLADYEKIIRENNERSLEAFDRRPKSPCTVQRIPEFQEANAAANYSSPAKDGSRPGIFRVPLPGPNFSRAGMKTLAAHEAIPGHHFQLALQVEMTSLPEFRRQGGFNAFTEGWGLYAELLASELGWYKDDPVSDIGRLNAELFRAKRLVVDTGLHAKRWTRQQAIDYGIARSEVDRYVMLPGQACSYKIGQMKILELREESKKNLGPKFSLKEFHNVVLGNGGLPLSVLERLVRDWQKQKKA